MHGTWLVDICTLSHVGGDEKFSRGSLLTELFPGLFGPLPSLFGLVSVFRRPIDALFSQTHIQIMFDTIASASPFSPGVSMTGFERLDKLLANNLSVRQMNMHVSLSELCVELSASAGDV